MNKQPFFYDITLRDGNQALKKPWNTAEKEIIFKHLIDLGVQGIEVGFPNANEMDFEACQHLASIAPDNIVISGLARSVEPDINRVAEALKACAKPRIHVFITMSPFHMKYVLNKSPKDVKKAAIDAVKHAKSVIGPKGEVQFSVEHFGDCNENLPFVIESLNDIVEAGATILNLPNTVERTRPMNFINMVSKVIKSVPKNVTVAVHCHNDLGMATATTVESYFAGAAQLECSLNGLGERTGNTNIYEVAVALHNSGVNVPLNLCNIYETALLVADMSKIKIHDKMPLIGPDALAHRSGIHQDGALKTKDMEKGAYRPIHPSLIGRDDDEKLGITSQSGKTAVYEIINKTGYPITIQEAARIAPFIKEAAEKVGELPTRNILDIYFKEVFKVKGPFVLKNFDKISDGQFRLQFTRNGKEYDVIGSGNGYLDGCLSALKQADVNLKLLHYEQSALDEEIKGVEALAMTVIHFESTDGSTIVCRGKDESTSQANVKAIFNGLNIMYKV